MSFFSFLFPRVVYSQTSRINGTVQVVEQFGKRELVVGGLQQSGDLVEHIWEKTLKGVKYQASSIKNVLVLGLGGGSAMKVLSNYYPQAKIIGIEIDPVIIDAGKQYFGLRKYENLKIVQGDAFEYVNHKNDSNHFNKFDLILVDLYVGEEIPKKLKSDAFLKNLKRLLSKNGVVAINHLRGKKRIGELGTFEKQLKQVFPSISIVKPLVNQVFICS